MSTFTLSILTFGMAAGRVGQQEEEQTRALFRGSGNRLVVEKSARTRFLHSRIPESRNAHWMQFNQIKTHSNTN